MSTTFHRIRTWTWGIYGMYTVFTLIIWAFRWVPTDLWWPGGAATILFNFLIFGHVFFAILWLFLSFRKSCIAVLLLIFFAWQAGWGYHPFSAPNSNDISISLINYGNFSGSKESARKEGIRGMLLEQLQSDLVIVNEARFTETDFFSSESLFKRLGYTFTNIIPFKKNGKIQQGIAVLSKYPVSNIREINIKPIPDKSTNTALSCQITIHGKNIQLIAFHLASNGVSPTTIQENEGVNMLRKVKSNFLQRYQPAEKVRAYEARILSSSIQKSSMPLIVVGDFNDPPSSYVYHTIRGSLQDAFSSCGWGWGSTYSGPIPFLRIDNIFCSDQMTPTSFEILPTNISDHHPIKATFNLH